MLLFNVIIISIMIFVGNLFGGIDEVGSISKSGGAIGACEQILSDFQAGEPYSSTRIIYEDDVIKGESYCYVDSSGDAAIFVTTFDEYGNETFDSLFKVEDIFYKYDYLSDILVKATDDENVVCIDYFAEYTDLIEKDLIFYGTKLFEKNSNASFSDDDYYYSAYYDPKFHNYDYYDKDFFVFIEINGDNLTMSSDTEDFIFEFDRDYIYDISDYLEHSDSLPYDYNSPNNNEYAPHFNDFEDLKDVDIDNEIIL